MDEVVKKWIEEIKKFVFNLDIDDNLKNETFNMIDSQYSLIKEGIITNEIYGTFNYKVKTVDKFNQECKSFIEYLYYVLENKGTKYFETAIKYSLNNSSEISFVDSFIRFIIITNFDDIEFNINFDVDSMLEKDNVNNYAAARGYIRAYLGGFLLCDLSQFSLHHDDIKYLDFYNFHVRKNLKKTKIGTLTLRKLLEIMISNKSLSDYSLGSAWVEKNNVEGKKFYEKFGFKFLDNNGMVVNYDYYDKYIKVKKEDYPELSQEEFFELKKKMCGYFFVIIFSHEKNGVLSSNFKYPYIIYNDEIIDCNTRWSVKTK